MKSRFIASAVLAATVLVAGAAQARPGYMIDPSSIHTGPGFDYDRDGIPNSVDRDRDGDGIRNDDDRYPGDPRRD